MRNPWLIELRREGKTVSSVFTTKLKADYAWEFSIDFQAFESLELFNRQRGRKSILKCLMVDGQPQITGVRKRYPARAKATSGKRQVSQIVDCALMKQGLTARKARAARKAIFEFWVQELKQGREVLTPFGLLRVEVQEIQPSKESMARYASYLEAGCEAEELNAAPPPAVAQPRPRFKRVFVLDRIPPELDEPLALVQPDGSEHL